MKLVYRVLLTISGALIVPLLWLGLMYYAEIIGIVLVCCTLAFLIFVVGMVIWEFCGEWM